MVLDVVFSIRKECERRKYSERTIESYTSCVMKFIDFCGKGVDKLGRQDALDFLNYLNHEKKVSGNTMNVYHMAIRFFLEDILRKRMRLDIHYSRVPQKMPVYLTKEETKKLIGKIHNWKHRLMIEVMYGAGLRVSELINLRVENIEIEKGFGFVRQGKGSKDRIFVLSKIVQDKMKNLIEIEKLSKEDFVFNTNRRQSYSARSLQEIIKRAAKLAEIDKKIGCHTLRHSFATHLIENGYSVGDVQIMLGHSSPETSMIYVHMASPSLLNIKSPLDSL